MYRHSLTLEFSGTDVRDATGVKENFNSLLSLELFECGAKINFRITNGYEHKIIIQGYQLQLSRNGKVLFFEDKIRNGTEEEEEEDNDYEDRYEIEHDEDYEEDHVDLKISLDPDKHTVAHAFDLGYLVDNKSHLYKFEIQLVFRKHISGSALASDMYRLLKTKEFADVTLQVRDQKFQAHRIILAARSDYFKTMFSVNMKEKESGLVNLEDCCPNMFRAFVKLIYGGSRIKHPVELFRLADRFLVNDIKDKCSDMIVQQLSKVNVLDTLLLADQYRDNDMKLACFQLLVKMERHEQWEIHNKVKLKGEDLADEMSAFFAKPPAFKDLEV